MKKNKAKTIPSIIPKLILENTKISDGAKVFFGAVVFLSNEDGVSFAGTRYYAKQLGRTTRSIQYYISELLENKLIDLEIKNGIRYIYPSVLILNNNEVGSYIPPEILANPKVSSAVKLSYGTIQYRSGNKHGFLSYSGINDLTDLIGKSKSTTYRHLNIYKKLKLVKFEKSDALTKIYTFNSYQDALIKNIQKAINKSIGLDPPNKNKRPISSINLKQAEILKQLVGRN